jgi:cation diffusion facilitator CzcD-associated flavoprotein CzcO
VPGVERFPVKLHSAAWDDSVDLTDKVVGIIGNGSSAVQIIPAIFPSMSLDGQLPKKKGLQLTIPNRGEETQVFHEILHLDHGRVCAEIRWRKRGQLQL